MDLHGTKTQNQKVCGTDSKQNKKMVIAILNCWKLRRTT